jgi:predicted metalloprotease with PDZ domain
MALLRVDLAPLAEGVRVRWRLEGVTLPAHGVLAEIPVEIAGTPTVALGEPGLRAVDERGVLELVTAVEDVDGTRLRRWRVRRATAGPLEVSYLALPADVASRPGTPPLDLRREDGGGSGALSCFVVLPPGPADTRVELRCTPADGWSVVSSLGDDATLTGGVRGAGLEQLGDTFLVYGDLGERHHRDGPLSVWWLASPPFDVATFSARLGTTYDVLAATFDAPAAPYRVFLRTHEQRGLTASAHPSSFVMALNPSDPPDEGMLFETIAHEVVHEWLHLDGTQDEVTWFVEGAADYYSLVVPHRHGLIDDETLVRSLNLAARQCWAGPHRDLPLGDAQRLASSDLWARRLPYGRGLFYLADLDHRLRTVTAGRTSLDDVVRDVVRRRRDDDHVDVAAWCARVDAHLGGDESAVLEAYVLSGRLVPAGDTFGPGVERRFVEVPVLDLGFDVSTLMTLRIRGLTPGGAAERAGLREGDAVALPSWSALLRLDVGDEVEVRATHAGESFTVRWPVGTETVSVPQWRPTRA